MAFFQNQEMKKRANFVKEFLKKNIMGSNNNLIKNELIDFNKKII